MVARKLQFPVHLETNSGVSMLAIGLVAPMAVFMPFLFLTSLGVGEATTRPPVEFGVTELTGILISALSIFLYQWRSVLDADERGVQITEGRWTVLFRWKDIRDVTIIVPSQYGPNGPVNTGVRINLLGRSDWQNQHNLVPWDYGLDASAVASVIERGVQRWATSVRENDVETAKTNELDPDPADVRSTSAEIARKLYDFRFDRQAIIAPFAFLVLALNLSAWVELDYRRADNLYHHGVRLNAPTVNRYIRPDCVELWCPFDAEFRIPTSRSVENAATADLHSETISLRTYREDAYGFVAKTKTIPIVYDPRHPDIYVVNFHDRVFAQTPIRQALLQGALVFGFMSPIPLVGCVLFLSANRRLRARG